MKKEVSVPIVAAVVAATPHWALAQATDQYGYGPHMMRWGGAMIFGPLFMVLVLALVVAIVVLVVRWLGGPWTPSEWLRVFVVPRRSRAWSFCALSWQLPKPWRVERSEIDHGPWPS